ncbi:GtrA family protein [Candidatus Saccharibacteria bacterium]|nr:GtrA family protein [Candidatus Saccharibacteria bacterium]
MAEKKGLSEKTKQKGKYLIFGLLNTGINYGMYEALALLVFKEEGQLWIATLISGAISIFVGYFLHSKFTWKDREVGKTQLGKFFIWNVIMNIAVRPALTWFFGLFGFLYKFAFDICQTIGLPFSYEFVETTGNYVLMTAVVMVINFLVYDKFVFGKTKTYSKPKEEPEEQ